MEAGLKWEDILMNMNKIILLYALMLVTTACTSSEIHPPVQPPIAYIFPKLLLVQLPTQQKINEKLESSWNTRWFLHDSKIDETLGGKAMSIQALHDALVVAFRTYSGSMIPVPDEHMGEQVRSVLQGILQNDMLVTRFENELTTEGGAYLFIVVGLFRVFF